MKKIFLNIALVIFMSSLLLTLCGQHRFMKTPVPAPDKHFPFIEEPGKKCLDRLIERHALQKKKTLNPAISKR